MWYTLPSLLEHWSVLSHNPHVCDLVSFFPPRKLLSEVIKFHLTCTTPLLLILSFTGTLVRRHPTGQCYIKAFGLSSPGGRDKDEKIPQIRLRIPVIN